LQVTSFCDFSNHPSVSLLRSALLTVLASSELITRGFWTRFKECKFGSSGSSTIPSKGLHLFQELRSFSSLHAVQSLHAMTISALTGGPTMKRIRKSQGETITCNQGWCRSDNHILPRSPAMRRVRRAGADRWPPPKRPRRSRTLKHTRPPASLPTCRLVTCQLPRPMTSFPPAHVSVQRRRTQTARPMM